MIESIPPASRRAAVRELEFARGLPYAIDGARASSVSGLRAERGLPKRSTATAAST